jgi:tricorn protease
MTAVALLLASVFALPLTASAEGSVLPGYYRYPTIHGDTIIFTAEGDLWSVSTIRRRSTTADIESGEGNLPSHFSGWANGCVQR